MATITTTTASTEPITPARFAAALQDLPLSSLALKVAELRNSIAHLDYSNEQLKPFAYPASSSSIAAATVAGRAVEEGDQDCVEAIQENEAVIERMQARITLLREEVERRGASWRELGGGVLGEGREDEEKSEMQEGMVANGVGGDDDGEAPLNRHGDAAAAAGVGSSRHAAWRDGTFQTGTIGGGGGVVALDQGAGQGQRRQQGGSLGDEELRRRLGERMRDDDDEVDEDDGGMHL